MSAAVMSETVPYSCSRTEPQVIDTRNDSSRSSQHRSKYDRALWGRYKCTRTIGTGNFAKVKLATHVMTGKEVAIKIVNKTELSPSSRRKLSREVRLMKLLDHPNIVKLLEVVDTAKTLYLIMEYASGGELYEYLANHGRMTEKMAREKFRQILSAVQYCHQKGIIHRDLKTENLLLDSNMNIKLVDFGFANEFHPGTKLNTFCGSPPYAAPELFRGREYDGPEVDVWSLGVVLFKLVSGALPFDGHSLPELRERVLRGRYRIPFYMSTECERLLKKMLVLNPSKRHSLESIMRDRWVNLGYENEPLLPYVEPRADAPDPERIKLLMNMGFNLESIVRSIKQSAFDEITATYYLLGKHQNTPENSPDLDENVIRDEDHLRSSTPTLTETPSFSPGSEKRSIEDAENTSTSITNSSSMSNYARSLSIRTTPGIPNGVASDSEVGSVDTGYENPHEYNKQTEDRVITIKGNGAAQKDDDYVANHVNAESIEPKSGPRSSRTTSDQESGSNQSDSGSLSPPRDTKRPDSSTDSENFEPIPHSARYRETFHSRYENGGESEKPEPSRGDNPMMAAMIKPSEKLSRCATTLEHGHEKVMYLPSSVVEPKAGNILDETNFSRLDPTRQTFHTTYRPTIVLNQDSPVTKVIPSADKNEAIGGARSNLFRIESEEEQPREAGLMDVPRSRGFFRSFTSRFTKKPRPLNDRHGDEADAGNTSITVPAERSEKQNGAPHTPTIRIIDNRMYPKVEILHESEAVENGHPGSNLESTPYAKIKPEIFIPEHKHIAPSERNGSNNLEEPDTFENRASNFFRSLAVRFSKRRHTHAINPESPDYQSSHGDHADRTTGHILPASIVSSLKTDPSDMRLSKAEPTVTLRHRESTKHNLTPPRSRFSQRESRTSSHLSDSFDEGSKPRVLRFTWSMKTTTKLPPEEVVQEIKRVLNQNHYTYEEHGRFLFSCDDSSAPVPTGVSWEMEVCELPRLYLHGIRFKKLTGTAVAYKNIMTKVTNEMVI
ncbi:unnamed protein product [Calicophoron daubneyi]|uniref:non-specific serine/threonine protein kinase n=1 Tax=Calicophoron daubneyi TaxID=300641 RepID=A0AAV2TEW5_CALDB